MFKNVSFIIAILTVLVSNNTKASYTLEELAALSSGTSAGYKIAAQGAINSGGFDPWAANQGGNGGNNEIYKNRIDPAAPNTLQAISNVKNTLAGNAGDSLLQDANNRVTALQTQIAQREATIQTGINALDPIQGTLPAAITSVKGVYGTGPGTTLLQDANNSVAAFQVQIAQRDATINTAITTLDTTAGQTLPAATQAVNDVVSTSGVGGNRGADILTDVTAARNALPNAGAGDLKARVLAVQGTINTAIADIDPTKGTLSTAITSVKTALGAGPGTTLLQDANNRVTALQTQIAQREATIQTGINALDPIQGTLPAAITSVKGVYGTGPGTTLLQDADASMNQIIALQATINTAITTLDTTVGQVLPGATQAVRDVVSTGGVGGNRGADVLTDVTVARNALPNAGGGDLKARALAVQGTITTAIADIDPAKTTLPAAITSVKTALGTGPGTTLLQDANANMTQITALQGTINNAIADIDPAQVTLPAAITSVKGVYGTGMGTTLLQDANNSVAAFQVQIAQRDATITTAITTLDTTAGQILPGATQAVNNVVSTGGVGGNRGADVLTDVTAARDALPNAGAGDLKARALAVGSTINNAIADIDSTKTTLPAAITSVMDIVANYTFARTQAEDVNVNYVSGTTSDASLRNEVAILFNILQTINTSSAQITRLVNGTTATATNVTLADIINFLKNRVNLN